MKENTLKKFIHNTPALNSIADVIYKAVGPFNGSKNYWQKRYEKGGNSGDGSYGNLAAFKARILNQFVADNNISTIIEYGCGDGNQLKQAEYPAYVGFDVSPNAIDLCNNLFAGDETKQFKLVDDYDGERAQLTLSLDVIYHLVEDPVFQCYMELLFDSSDQFVIIYSSDTDNNPKLRPLHVRHRAFSKWIAANRPNWKQIEKIENEFYAEKNVPGESFANFYIYKIQA